MPVDRAKRPENPSHPIQPIVLDKDGVLRFKKNRIVDFLLENGNHDLNELSTLGFSWNDWEQFAQLIGYSVSGFKTLSYVSEKTAALVDSVVENPETDQLQARIAYLEKTLQDLRKGLRESVALLYSIHPDDLAGEKNV